MKKKFISHPLSIFYLSIVNSANKTFTRQRQVGSSSTNAIKRSYHGTTSKVEADNECEEEGNEDDEGDEDIEDDVDEDAAEKSEDDNELVDNVYIIK